MKIVTVIILLFISCFLFSVQEIELEKKKIIDKLSVGLSTGIMFNDLSDINDLSKQIDAKESFIGSYNTTLDIRYELEKDYFLSTMFSNGRFFDWFFTEFEDKDDDNFTYRTNVTSSFFDFGVGFGRKFCLSNNRNLIPSIIYGGSFQKIESSFIFPNLPINWLEHGLDLYGNTASTKMMRSSDFIQVQLDYVFQIRESFGWVITPGYRFGFKSSYETPSYDKVLNSPKYRLGGPLLNIGVRLL